MNEKVKTSTADYGQNYQPEVNIMRAQRTFEEAQGELEQAQHQLANLPVDYSWSRMSEQQRRTRREEAVERVNRAKEDADLREHALTRTQNDAARYRYLAGLEAGHTARSIANEQEATRYAAKEEQEAKGRMYHSYVGAGGTPEQFAQAWPELWKMELATRAIAAQDATQNRLQRSGRYG